MAELRWGGRRAQQISRYVLERDGFRCRMIRDGRVCGRPATTADHIVPRSKGGALYDPENLRAACADCNFRAGGRLVGRARTPTSLTSRQTSIVAELDAAGLPHDAGRRHVLTMIGAAGRRWRSDDIDAACAWRRARAERTGAYPAGGYLSGEYPGSSRQW